MRGNDLRVLAYHRIAPLDARNGMPLSQVSATPELFERQVQHLAERYQVVSLEQVLDAQRGSSRLPPRAVLLTFDDGCRDFGHTAWPILRNHGLPATVFVPTAYPGEPERAFWWDRIHDAIRRTARRSVSLPPLGTLDLDTPAARYASFRRISSLIKGEEHHSAMAMVERLLTELDAAGPPVGCDVLGWSELRELARQGASVAPHTRTHPALTRLDPAAVAAEVAGSVEDVRREIGSVLPAFCYPFGLLSDTVVDILSEQGIELGFTCLDGHNDLPAVDPLRLRRTEITPRTTPAMFGLRLSRAVTYVDMWRHRKKYPRSDGAGSPRDSRSRGHGAAAPKVAYIMSRFPKLSETFVLNEMTALDSSGVAIEVFPLLREHQPVSHPEAERWVRRARFQPFLSLPVVRANAHFMRHRPRAYFGVLYEVLRGTLGSLNFFLGALGIFPKSVRFAYEMRALKITHVHAHFATHPAVAALIVHRLIGIPFSFTAHGSDLHVDRRMLRQKVEAAAFAVTVAEFNRDVMVRECGKDLGRKIHVVRCGVDPSFFAPAEGARSERFEIVCVASLEEVKGHRFLIEACGLLRDRGITFRCHLVGDGPLRTAIGEQIDALGLAAVVRVHGGLPRSTVADLLRSAHVAVLASHPTRGGKREGLPVALMEAMACGLPIVASGISGIPELVETERTGLLVPSGDARALAAALARLAADPSLRQRMGAEGRQKVLREFDLRLNATRLFGLISAGAPAAAREHRAGPAAVEATVSAPLAGSAFDLLHVERGLS